MIHDELSCVRAREQLSARMDGEHLRGEHLRGEHLRGEHLRGEHLHDGALRAHLATCGACRTHERGLAALTRGFEALREAEPFSDLWPRIERRLHPRRPRPFQTSPVLARVAAALIGFAGLGGAALLVERERAGAPPGRHLLERLAPAAGPDSLFASLPEYRILRAFPSEVDER